jgi:3-phosphoshikimate 1-carboxyvinyltransferase
MKSETKIVVRPARNVRGNVVLPGDKSISHRYAMLAGIAEGASRIENYSTGADCASTLGCMRALGVDWQRSGNAIEVRGRGPALDAPSSALDCGNSGSTMRMLSGIVAGQNFMSEMIGDESLSRRPMERVIKPLSAMGARIESPSGKPPLRITGGVLKSIDYKMPVASAQVKSCLLFAGLFAEGEMRIEESVRTRDHGEVALRAFGAKVERKSGTSHEVRIRGGQKLRGIEARIPGDLSSAAFFLCAAALFPGSQLTLPNLLMNPTRARLLDILMQMGLGISVTNLDEIHGELVGSLQVDGARLRGAKISGADSAALIDEIPVLAAVAPFSEQGIEVRDAKELRVKESDRIASVASNLRLMGARVEEFEDGLRVPGGQSLHGAELDSFGDHRIAMAFAVAALRADGETVIGGAESAAISYPAFFETLEEVTERFVAGPVREPDPAGRGGHRG